LRLELLIAELELLDHPGKLPDLGFQPIEPDHEVGCTRLRRALQTLSLQALSLQGLLRLRAALAAKALAAPMPGKKPHRQSRSP
jgi:hypothetical protein